MTDNNDNILLLTNGFLQGGATVFCTVKMIKGGDSILYREDDKSMSRVILSSLSMYVQLYNSFT